MLTWKSPPQVTAELLAVSIGTIRSQLAMGGLQQGAGAATISTWAATFCHSLEALTGTTAPTQTCYVRERMEDMETCTDIHKCSVSSRNNCTTVVSQEGNSHRSPGPPGQNPAIAGYVMLIPFINL